MKDLTDTRHTAKRDGPQVLDAARLFRDHAEFVANFAIRLGVGRPEVDDVVQEVFLVAHRRGGFVPGPARPTTWLAEITLRVVSASRRKLRRSWEDADTEAVAAASAQAGSSPGEQAEASEALRRVQQALDTLEEGKRAVFILFELEGESCEAIAAGLGIPIGTVYSRLHKARKQFMEAHARLVAGPPRPLARSQTVTS
ncbi:RNA polymerase sigma factor [Nannocystis bainbridge]|uniref:RNA polymerase sigma factor n=1 Tax=Nannocystis bainbridge TaxID=2995303 RepID=A0ABT5E3R6_9BACT|nr:RNA polymerase sigma factor [Nannocystis bainbridge]MDC0720035.1 RNA polymerase sigma factor [Nannocystis bainbridge]